MHFGIEGKVVTRCVHGTCWAARRDTHVTTRATRTTRIVSAATCPAFDWLSATLDRLVEALLASIKGLSTVQTNPAAELIDRLFKKNLNRSKHFKVIA